MLELVLNGSGVGAITRVERRIEKTKESRDVLFQFFVFEIVIPLDLERESFKLIYSRIDLVQLVVEMIHDLKCCLFTKWVGFFTGNQQFTTI